MKEREENNLENNMEEKIISESMKEPLRNRILSPQKSTLINQRKRRQQNEKFITNKDKDSTTKKTQEPVVINYASNLIEPIENKRVNITKTELFSILIAITVAFVVVLLYLLKTSEQAEEKEIIKNSYREIDRFITSENEKDFFAFVNKKDIFFYGVTSFLVIVLAFVYFFRNANEEDKDSQTAAKE